MFEANSLNHSSRGNPPSERYRHYHEEGRREDFPYREAQFSNKGARLLTHRSLRLVTDSIFFPGGGGGGGLALRDRMASPFPCSVLFPSLHRLLIMLLGGQINRGMRRLASWIFITINMCSRHYGTHLSSLCMTWSNVCYNMQLKLIAQMCLKSTWTVYPMYLNE